MALVRAVAFGVDSAGGKVKPGQTFEHTGPLGTWMELVEGGDPAPAPSEPAQESEAAPHSAETNKRNLRNRKVTPKGAE